ncbi:MAG TPA: MerR family transcriptional regulator, partial [Patescibacteria group bacterium]|nr:MerR family transcriptional regulator [Patescibacteria group bacterium]
MENNLSQTPRSLGEVGPEKFIPVSEVAKRSGVGYHTLRYYTKIGLLPYMSRRLPYPDAPSTVGHYPERVLETLKKIADLKKQGWDNGRIKKELESPQMAPSVAPTPDTVTPIPPQPPPPPISLLIAPIINEEHKQSDLLGQLFHFLTNMIRTPLPTVEPLRSKVFSHALTLALVAGAVFILALGFSDLTRERIQRTFSGFWDQYVERLVPGNFLGIAQVADPIVDTNDVLEYKEFNLTRWLHSKLPFLFDTGRFLGTLFFGDDSDYFISPLGIASLRDLRAIAITAGEITVDSINVENLTVTGTTTGVTGTGGSGGGGIATGGDADTLGGQPGSYYLDLDNETGTCTNCLTGAEINESTLVGIDASALDGQAGSYYLDLGNEVGTCSNCLTTTEIDESTLSITASNADTLDLLDSLQFLRSDTDDSFTSGTLTIADGTTLTINSTAINLGNAVTDLVIFNGTVDSDIIPSLNANYDIGSAGVRWDIGYFDEIVVNTLSAGASDIAGTTSSDFAVNTDNATADTEDATLTFIRGTSSPNAVLRWDSTLDQYLFESFPLALDGQLISGVTTGTSPFSISSTTLVTNLNADLFDDLNSDQFLRSDVSTSYTGTGTLTTDSGTTVDINGALAWGGATVTEDLDMAANIITNIGDTGTDFDTGGGLTLAGDLTVTGGEIFLNPITSSGSTTEGTIYYDSDNDKLYVYADGAFQRLATD